MQVLLAQAPDELIVDSRKEAFAAKLCSKLDSIILHAKQVAESPRTGDRAGDRLLQSCDEVVGNLATVLQIASEEDVSQVLGVIASPRLPSPFFPFAFVQSMHELVPVLLVSLVYQGLQWYAAQIGGE